mmetsp:Transcript_66992/g.119144  ORF Transcript_66992/g.119144 Transcript_66992/m.119144 type:complete len:368 (-) Transcript_66992:85-1188(-)
MIRSIPIVLRHVLSVSFMLQQLSEACSSWFMENDFTLSARTLDNQPTEWIGRAGSGITVVPRGALGALGIQGRYGYAGFFAMENATGQGPSHDVGIRMGGLNEAGLSCDEQHLTESEYQTPSHNPDIDLPTHLFCEWAVMQFSSIFEVRDALLRRRLVRGLIPGGVDSGHHYTLRDSNGTSLVVEAIKGDIYTYVDYNDAGITGFGVVTNSPPFPWQLETLRNMQSKIKSQHASVAMPGSWYPDERFQRIWLVKSGMNLPADYPSAVAQAFTVMDTVTVPEGTQIGTDGIGTYTIWGAVYDHLKPTIYWRTARNHNTQRLRLQESCMHKNSQRLYISVNTPLQPWFNDAASSLRPIPATGLPSTVHV